jgi:hypothetical protein
VIRNNVIANNPENGIVLSNISDADHNGYGATYYNTISQNSIYNNGPAQPSASNIGWGILMLEKSGAPAGGAWPNAGLPAPRITNATVTVVVGTARTAAGSACANCTIEVFIADTTALDAPQPANVAGEGKTFVGAGLTDASGNFAVLVRNVLVGQLVTATTTDPSGNTSQFSRNVIVTNGQVTPPTPTPGPPPTPLPTPGPGPQSRPYLWLPLIRNR